jgi:arsenate reductase
MAEGFGEAFSDRKFKIKSAGVTPIGVHPAAIAAMREVGIDISEHTSDLLTEQMIAQADYVITLCGHARDRCPVMPPTVKHFHWDIDNPDRIYMSEEARRVGFAEVRDEIKRRVEKLFNEIYSIG